MSLWSIERRCVIPDFVGAETQGLSSDYQAVIFLLD